MLLKWTPSLEVWSKNRNQARITILRSTQPCSILARRSSIKSSSKEKGGSHYGSSLVLSEIMIIASKINTDATFCRFGKTKVNKWDLQA